MSPKIDPRRREWAVSLVHEQRLRCPSDAAAFAAAALMAGVNRNSLRRWFKDEEARAVEQSAKALRAENEDLRAENRCLRERLVTLTAAMASLLGAGASRRE